MRHRRDVVGKFLGYLLSGGGAALVDIVLFRLLAPAIGIIPGAALSFLIAAVCNFLVTSRCVFGHSRGLRHGLFFLGFAAIGLIINVSATVLIVSAFHPPLILAKTGGVGVAFVFNFAANYLIVFRRPHTSSPDASSRDHGDARASIPNL